jgi:ribosomal protein S18 acetylase RimI-like enzyme
MVMQSKKRSGVALFVHCLKPMPPSEALFPRPDSPVRIRIASEADRRPLLPLVNSAFSIETFMEGTRTDGEQLAAAMRQGDILVAEQSSGQLLGCVYSEVRGKRGYLGMLAVDPAHQRAGIARLIVGAAEEHLRRQGCEAVEIIVLSLRPELPSIYRRFGYIETGTKEFNPSRALKPGTECHCILMSKPL